MSQNVNALHAMDGVQVGIAGEEFSQVYDVNVYRPLGNFGSQINIQNADTDAISVELWASIDGVTYAKASTMFSNMEDGDYIRSFGSSVCRKFKIRVANAGTQIATVSVWIGLQ